MNDHEIELNLAAIRARMVEALGDDTEAIKVLDRVYPADWGDAPGAVVWMLGNAARFATNTTGQGAAFSQNWLDRLVHPDGEPKDELEASTRTALPSPASSPKNLSREGTK